MPSPAPRIIDLGPGPAQAAFEEALRESSVATERLAACCERLVAELQVRVNEEKLLRRIIAENEARIDGLRDIIKDRDATIASAEPSDGTNIIEATAPADRPREAVSQLRDLCAWLQSEGEDELSEVADDLADDIARSYKGSV